MGNPWDERYNKDEFVYGTEVNSFLKSQINQLPSSGNAIALADGEGRNGVWLAQKGFDVLSVDASQVGLEKAAKLANSQNVSLSTKCVDLTNWDWPQDEYDLAVSIFLHMPSEHRPALHRNMLHCLKPGGYLLMEVFSKAQLGRGSGGPPTADWLYDKGEFMDDFKNMEIMILEEVQDILDEGALHQGEASLLRFVAKKPL